VLAVTHGPCPGWTHGWTDYRQLTTVLYCDVCMTGDTQAAVDRVWAGESWGQEWSCWAV